MNPREVLVWRRHARRARARCGLAIACVLAGASPLPAQETASADPVAFHSMGQPPLFKPYVAGSFTWNREG